MEKYDESIADFKEAIEQVKMDGNSSDERSLASELRKAEAALKRSKTKDYYKILGILIPALILRGPDLLTLWGSSRYSA